MMDRYEDKALTLIDKNTFSLVGRYINIGNAPGEVRQGRLSFSIQGSRLYVYQTNTGGTMNIYSLPDFRYIESVQIANNPAEVQRLPDYYVGNAGFGAEGRLQVYDKTGKLLFVGSDYPDNGSNVSDNYRFVDIGCELVFYPAGHLLWLAKQIMIPPGRNLQKRLPR